MVNFIRTFLYLCKNFVIVIIFSFRIETHGIAHFINNWHKLTNNNTVSWRLWAMV
jgi:hypothetical protein